MRLHAGVRAERACRHACLQGMLTKIEVLKSLVLVQVLSATCCHFAFNNATKRRSRATLDSHVETPNCQKMCYEAMKR